MSFNLEKFIESVFKPEKGEVITVMYDLPHGKISDNNNWKERRQMARDWQKDLSKLADKWSVKVNPIVTYEATGGNNADLPEKCMVGSEELNLNDVINSSTIILAMPEFSTSAPLYLCAKSSKKLRVGSMPGVQKFMEKTGLSADYTEIAETCKKLKSYFEKAIGAEVEFSTGHKCYFDLPNKDTINNDDAILHPSVAGTANALSNLPAGEVCAVPNENLNSKTEGELPEKIDDELLVYQVRNNRIYDVKGDGPNAKLMRENFKKDPAWQNLAEFAIGCNNKAKVTGIVLEDEKAGFHFAYGRSDHLGGKVGVKDFISPDNVVHQDIVYAKDSPIVCKKLDMINPDGSRETLIIDGKLQV